MATWIDLSAHNLALWRIGEDRNGLRLYALLPVFPAVKHTRPDPDSEIGSRFSWNRDVGGYVFHLRHAEERLPPKDLWLEQFPGALFRDRDAATFRIHQPSFLTAQSLPMMHPWVWSNQENPERFYANEEQALADGAGPAVLRAADEVDARGIREIAFPVDSGAMEEPASALRADNTADIPMIEVDDGISTRTESDSVSPANWEPPLAEGLAAPANSAERQDSGGKRLDYGEAIPGARKSPWENLQADIALQSRIKETTGSLDGEALRALSGRTRRDAIWGTLKDRLARPDVAASPLKRALWIWAYQETPASAKSTYWSNTGRNKAIPPENLYLRVIAYPEVLRSIERRIDGIDEGVSGMATADQLIDALAGDFRRGHPEGVTLFTNPYPTEPYARLPDALRDRALRVFPVSMEAYAALLDHPYYGVCDLISGLRKDSSTRVLEDAVGALMSRDANAADPERRAVLEQSFRDSFVEVIPDFVENAVRQEREYCEKIIREQSSMNGYVFQAVARRVGSLLDANVEDALRGDDARVASVLDRYMEAYARKKTEFFLGESRSTFFLRDAMKMAIRAADGEAFSYADPSKEAYRRDQDMNRALAVLAMEKVVKHLNFAADLLKKSENDVSSDVAVADPEQNKEAGDEAEDARKEPSFIRWNPAAKPLPPEKSESEGYRTGPGAIRGDRDVTEEELCERFGLRGVQYGNWMTQKDRQEHLNAAFDGLQDIQAIIGLEEPKSIGLPRKTRDGNGQRRPLALALGARGRGGRAAAHYEPGLHVINMTKTKGAGSLLHEWTHAVDHFVGAELSQGGATPASRIPGNPIFEHVKMLKSAVKDVSKEESRRIIVEKARDLVIPIISNAMISKDIQENVKFGLRYHFIQAHQKELMDRFEDEYQKVKRGEMQPEERTVSKEDVDAKRRIGRDKGVTAFDEALPMMVAATDKLLARLDQAMAQGNMAFSSASMEVLVDQVYQYKTSRVMQFNELTAKNWLRDLLGLPAFPDEAACQAMEKRIDEKDPTVSDADVVAQLWGNAVFSGFWKKMASKIVNKNPYTQVMRDTSGQSHFFAQALTLDGKKLAQGESYWSSDVEILARSVAAIGYDKLRSMGIENTYLTDAVPERYSGSRYRADSEPQGKERDAFYQDFFERVCPRLQETIRDATEDHYAERLPNEEESRITAEKPENVLAGMLENAEGGR